jgi:hypothetical protein
VRAVNPYLQVHCGSYEAFAGVPVASLCAPDNPALDEQLAIMGREYRTDNAEVLTRFFLRGFAYYLASSTVGPFVQDRRVPALALDTVGMTFGSWGGPDAVILRHSRYFCLHTDAAALHPDAIPVPDVATLRLRLREGLVDVCAPLIDALRGRARIGARAMWVMVAESCAGVLVDALPAATPEREARAEVSALIGEPTSPLRAKPEILALAAQERRGLAMLGNDCCCNFRLPDADYCDNCPHRPREERLAALREWIATRPTATATA